MLIGDSVMVGWRQCVAGLD